MICYVMPLLWERGIIIEKSSQAPIRVNCLQPVFTYIWVFTFWLIDDRRKFCILACLVDSFIRNLKWGSVKILNNLQKTYTTAIRPIISTPLIWKKKRSAQKIWMRICMLEKKKSLKNRIKLASKRSHSHFSKRGSYSTNASSND